MTKEEAVHLLRSGKEGIQEWNRRRRVDELPPDLSGIDLSGAFLVEAMLGGVEFTNADLRGANLAGANLDGADLIFARLEKANLRDARLVGAHLTGADLTGADLGGACLTSSQLIQTHLVGARCERACFQHADLSHAELRDADLTAADLSHALLSDVDLTGATLKCANFEHAAVMGVKYRRSGLVCRGIRVDSCHGHAVFKRDVQDQDWIETFSSQSRRNRLIYLIWLFFTDCGRSLGRVWLTATTLAMLFGTVYAHVPSLLNTTRAVNSWWTPYYYSFVTFTTLGFGDVTPGSLAGEIIVTIEVILGYLTLGILVSILANKVARRS